MLPSELKEEYRKILFYEEDNEEYKVIIKAADKIAAYIKCIEEEKAGNQEFLHAAKAILDKILEIESPEVEFFMNRFIPAYKLTLDELN